MRRGLKSEIVDSRTRIRGDIGGVPPAEIEIGEGNCQSERTRMD